MRRTTVRAWRRIRTRMNEEEKLTESETWRANIIVRLEAGCLRWYQVVTTTVRWYTYCILILVIGGIGKDGFLIAISRNDDPPGLETIMLECDCGILE